MREMEVANLTCKSIDGTKELLDVFKEQFLPAIKTVIVPGSRKSETHSYRFLDIKIEKKNEGLILRGRLVKSLNIEREQILQNGKLVDSIETLRSDPSSFFVLFLNNHKLLWVKEVKRAPSLIDFKYVLTRALKTYRKEIIDSSCAVMSKEYTDNKTKEEKLNYIKKERLIYSKYPQLEIELTPLGNKVSIEEEFNNFESIVNIKIKALKRNQELGSEYNKLLESMSNTQELSGANYLTTEIRGSKRKSLDIQESKKIVTSASDGNYEFSVKGYDSDNNLILKKETDFSIHLNVVYDKSKAIFSNVTKMIEGYVKAVNKYNSLQLDSEDILDKISEIENSIVELNND